MLRIGIMGATGYTGLELLKILGRHPAARDRLADLGKQRRAVLRPGVSGPAAGRRSAAGPAGQADLSAADVVFACLPHAAAQAPVAAAHAAGARVVDLSADYRLHDAANYQAWYGVPHTQPVLLAEAVYGLPELHRAQIAARPADRQPRLLSDQRHPGPGAAGAGRLAARHGHRRQQIGRLRGGPHALAQDPFCRGEREHQPLQHRPLAPPSGGDGAGARRTERRSEHRAWPGRRERLPGDLLPSLAARQSRHPVHAST